MQFILYVALSAKVSPFHLPALAPRKRIRGILVIFTRTSSLSLICRSLAHYMWVCQEKYLSINNILSVFLFWMMCSLAGTFSLPFFMSVRPCVVCQCDSYSFLSVFIFLSLARSPFPSHGTMTDTASARFSFTVLCPLQPFACVI